MTGELVASGSPRKRFDKAVKSGAKAIVALSLRDGEESSRIKASDEDTAKIEGLLS